MPVTLDLQENGRILFVKITDPWTAQEMLDVYPADLEYRNGSAFVMHTLIDIQSMQRIPPGIIHIGNRTPSINHPRHGSLAVIGASAFARSLFEIIIRITHVADAKFFDSEADARAYLLRLIANEDQQGPHFG